MRSAIVTILFVSFSLAVIGQRKEFKEAERKNEIYAYNKFLRQFPDSKFSNEARKKRDKLCLEKWEKVRKGEYENEVNNFISNCSETAYAGPARNLLEEINWKKASIYKTLSYNKFLEKHPQSKHRKEAEKIIENKLWAEVKKADRRTAIDSFLTAYPNTEKAGEAREILAEMEKYAVPRAAKEGDLEALRLNIPGAGKDMRSRALMEAVWGALHTGTGYRYDKSGFPYFVKTRSGKAPRETYIEIIKQLLQEAADPKRYAYADFGSNEVRNKENEEKKKNFNKQLKEKGVAEIRSVIGPSEKSGQYIDYGTGGLSILEVATIHKADDIIKLIKQ